MTKALKPCKKWHFIFVKGSFMRSFWVVMVLVLISGCSSMYEANLPQKELRVQIASGKVLHVGDEVKIDTADGKHYEFEVIKVTKGEVVGKDVTVSINDIVGLQTR
ncbi:MAG: hypothetical protein ACI9FJ_000759 [Alteromonadaceae bacterium]